MRTSTSHPDTEVVDTGTGSAQRGDRRVECRRRAHHGVSHRIVGTVVTADVSRVALDREQFCDDGLLLGTEQCCESCELLGQFGIRRLVSELLRPVEGQVEVASPIVESAELAAWRAILVQERASCPVEGAG